MPQMMHPERISTSPSQDRFFGRRDFAHSITVSNCAAPCIACGVEAVIPHTVELLPLSRGGAGAVAIHSKHRVLSFDGFAPLAKTEAVLRARRQWASASR